MKKLIILITFMIFYSYANGEVYYCSEKKTVGFKIGENETMNFHEKRFKVKIDMSKPSIESAELYFRDYHYCNLDKVISTFYCLNDVGWIFTFNTINKHFIRGSAFLEVNQQDNNVIAWGTCETF